MAVMRTYSIDIEGALTVIHEPRGQPPVDLSAHYKRPLARDLEPSVLEVEESGRWELIHRAKTDGAVRAAVELLLAFNEDLLLERPNPRAFG